MTSAKDDDRFKVADMADARAAFDALKEFLPHELDRLIGDEPLSLLTEMHQWSADQGTEFAGKASGYLVVLSRDVPNTEGWGLMRLMMNVRGVVSVVPLNSLKNPYGQAAAGEQLRDEIQNELYGLYTKVKRSHR